MFAFNVIAFFLLVLIPTVIACAIVEIRGARNPSATDKRR